MDELVYEAVFTEDKDRQIALFTLIKEAAKAAGAVPASIQGLYEDMGKNYPGFTVPAINIRGLTYDTARAIFRKANQVNAGAIIFEIARSEIGYTKQRPWNIPRLCLQLRSGKGSAARCLYRVTIFSL